MKYSFFYILSVVAINFAFTYIPNFTLYDGTVWSVGSILAGFVFVARDYAQLEVGHKKVLLLMVVSCGLSFYLSDPFVAVASMTAFATSEIIDYLVYTCSRGSHKRKVVLSSVLSVPVDTFVFLTVISSVSVVSFGVMTCSKFVAVLFVMFRSGGEG